jgi:catechol 2,3-dioxygenase-like lactoylglutathione lyase family enzyme
MSPDPGAVTGIDHVSVPMQHPDAMTAFYRALGFSIAENQHLLSVYAGNQMINFHRPAVWMRESFELRAPSARPPCGDFCFVWDGTSEALHALLDDVDAPIIEGPVARRGGRGSDASSVYVRDPDGNLLEFMIYP